jgi:hypothetical protein
MADTYCSPLQVRREAQVNYEQLGFDKESDYTGHLQETLIPAAQEQIDNFVGHNFLHNTGGTILLDSNGLDFLMIPPPYIPVLDITSVHLDNVEITSSIKFYPSYIAYPGGIFTKSSTSMQNVQVVLDYGYEEVPKDIMYVCMRLCANRVIDLVRRRMLPNQIAAAMQQEYLSMRGVLNAPELFTDELKEMLRPHIYSRMEVT